MDTKSYSVGIDIGGTKCAVVLGKGEIPQEYDPDFILERRELKTERKGWKTVLTRLMDLTEELLKLHGVGRDNLMGIGVSSGGPLDYKKGIIYSPPNLPGWDAVPVTELLSERFGVTARLQNDANACAVAEWKFGAARGKKNVIFLTFGTGLGAGLILDGRLYHGASDMAGETGHIRLSDYGPVGYGKTGSMEGFCSGHGIAQLARMRIMEKLQQGEMPYLLKLAGRAEAVTAELTAKAAKEGDPLAVSVFETSAEYLGQGISVLLDILNPEIVVIGSIYERCEMLLKGRMEEIIKKEALARSAECCKVVPAGLGERIGDYAALSVAFGL